ncbi:hypothetical protein EmuJ_000042000 [Echinococcus multilocularis]|uniref:Uncharacterized protein n=1 Tax=Echinococcus multilocularis TaxID=6211 RepID=A0A087VWS2_ECHMU|nr:hypothetical protein EmuJ_000042000 [Echinococcus multilocularis]
MIYVSSYIIMVSGKCNNINRHQITPISVLSSLNALFFLSYISFLCLGFYQSPNMIQLILMMGNRESLGDL